MQYKLRYNHPIKGVRQPATHQEDNALAGMDPRRRQSRTDKEQAVFISGVLGKTLAIFAFPVCVPDPTSLLTEDMAEKDGTALQIVREYQLCVQVIGSCSKLLFQ